MPNKLTIVIPVRNEIFLNKTIEDIFAKAAGDVEIIVGLDDCWEQPLPKDDPRITIIHWGKWRGHRAIINAGAEIGKGNYIMKVDSHCAFDEGFDVKLTENCDSDWMVTPRRYSLDFENWKPQKKPIDYEYIRYPYEDGVFVGTTAKYWWDERQNSRKDVAVDENMICQGSCMMMPMEYFKRIIYPMDEVSYGAYCGEQFEIMMKVWLSGGKCMTNKDTWYAHLWKGNAYRELYESTRGVKMPARTTSRALRDGIRYQTTYWFDDCWQERVHDFRWLVERFWPVPGWPLEWEQELREKKWMP